MRRKDFLEVDPTAMATRYLQGRTSPDERYASWDHCFNYFQESRRSGTNNELANRDRLQTSCLHLGFYLASWGMYRGKARLLQRSSRALAPVIAEVSQTPETVWTLDVDCYSDDSIELLLDTVARFREVLPGNPTDTLVTKTMLGIFGNIPAFDRYFRTGIDTSRLSKKSLRKVKSYYDAHASDITELRTPTLDFDGNQTELKYTHAKVIDMIFFVAGGGV